MATSGSGSMVALALILLVTISKPLVLLGVALMLIAGAPNVRQAWDFLSRLAR